MRHGEWSDEFYFATDERIQGNVETDGLSAFVRRGRAGIEAAAVEQARHLVVEGGDSDDKR